MGALVHFALTKGSSDVPVTMLSGIATWLQLKPNVSFSEQMSDTGMVTYFVEATWTPANGEQANARFRRKELK